MGKGDRGGGPGIVLDAACKLWIHIGMFAFVCLFAMPQTMGSKLLGGQGLLLNVFFFCEIYCSNQGFVHNLFFLSKFGLLQSFASHFCACCRPQMAPRPPFENLQ